jgi:predicted GNAT superfamily acetyltransferase
MNLPNRPINIKELEQCRKIQAEVWGVRYYKLAPRQAMEMMVEHNSKFRRSTGNPFDVA